jgi:hypothetical protein
MSKNTKYSVMVGGTEVATRSSKPAAIALAETHKGSQEVTVVTSAGNTVHTVKAVTQRAKPWTRTETPKFEAPEVEGFVAAYQRVRVGAVVYRALDKSGYLVLQPATGFRMEAENTTVAREITNALAARRKAEKAAAETASA